MGIFSWEKLYLHLSKEAVYFKKAVSLRPLAANREDMSYSWFGLALNLLSLVLLMVAGSSIYKTFCEMKKPHAVDNLLTIHIGLSLAFPLFFAMATFGVVLYQILFRFVFLESAYVVIYSVSSNLPIILLGRLCQLATPRMLRYYISIFIYLASGLVSTLFVNANIKRPYKSKRVKAACMCMCFFVQFWIAALSDPSLSAVWSIKFSM